LQNLDCDQLRILTQFSIMIAILYLMTASMLMH